MNNMLQYFIKVTISALLIVAISEISKRQSGVAALLASLPITSLLAFVWLYLETGNTDTISELSRQIFWLVIPSLILFLALPVLLRWGWGFWFSHCNGLWFYIRHLSTYDSATTPLWFCSLIENLPRPHQLLPLKSGRS